MLYTVEEILGNKKFIGVLETKMIPILRKLWPFAKSFFSRNIKLLKVQLVEWQGNFPNLNI